MLWRGQRRCPRGRRSTRRRQHVRLSQSPCLRRRRSHGCRRRRRPLSSPPKPLPFTPIPTPPTQPSPGMRFEPTQRHRNGPVIELQAVQPLWSMGIPNWAKVAWSTLKSALPTNEDWEVWIDWYEERLRGGSRSKDYELIFASVPARGMGKGSSSRERMDQSASPAVGRRRPQGRGFTEAAGGPLFGSTTCGRTDSYRAQRKQSLKIKKPREIFSNKSRRKAAELRERLFCVQADTRLQRTLTLLDDRLAPPIEAIRVGLVLSSLRSLASERRPRVQHRGGAQRARVGPNCGA